jgi:high-affinity nickel-transport protein
MTSAFRNLFNDEAGHIRVKVAGIYGILLVLNAGAWLWAIVAFHRFPVLLGTAFLAYSFGLRHAVDADHIAAIDNVTRKLMQEGKRPVAVGFMFSLGHSTIVIVGSLLIAAAALGLQKHLDHFRSIGGVIGTLVSSVFLLAIAVVNLIILRSVYRTFTRVRRGEPYVDEDLEIGLLGISAAEASRGLSLVSILVFPVLFAAGMSLIDTTDNILMLGAYGWAYIKPIRKLYYNLTITSVSVVVAFIVGGVEALGLLGGQFHLQGTFWGLVGRLNDNFGMLGYCIVAIFALAWVVSIAIYKLRRFEELELSAEG